MQPLLEPGHTCWRVARAERARVLVDAADYFARVREAMLAARHRIDIVGWDIDSRVRLVSDKVAAEDGAPAALGELLTWLCRRQPSLRVRLLLWDYSILYALEREPLPSVRLGWQTPPQVEVCLDDHLPLGACHHQKIVVVDDALAFSGGLDLTIRRWDTREHRAAHPQRTDPTGEHYAPFHDVQMMVDGDAAAALATLTRERWTDARCQEPEPVQPRGDCWPETVEAQFRDVDVGIALTVPELQERAASRQVEALFCAAIAAAEKDIYIENQYLTSEVIADALVERLQENAELGVVAVLPDQPDGWLEARTMGAGRLRFQRKLEQAGVADRVRILHPVVRGEDGGSVPVMVHAKLSVVDDRLLRVGSANLNNRSMGFDTECDLAIDAGDDEALRALVRAQRDDLLAEHLGRPREEVSAAVERHGSLVAAVDALRGGSARSLEPIHDTASQEDLITEAVSPIADPEQPIGAPELNLELFGGAPSPPPVSAIVKSALLATIVATLALVWAYTPLSQLTEMETLRGLVERYSGGFWTVPLVLAMYAVLGMALFPVTALILLTALLFGPVEAFFYALTGSLLSASLAYGIGRAAGRRFVRRLIGPCHRRAGRARHLRAAQHAGRALHLHQRGRRRVARALPRLRHRHGGGHGPRHRRHVCARREHLAAVLGPERRQAGAAGGRGAAVGRRRLRPATAGGPAAPARRLTVLLRPRGRVALARG